MVESSIEAVINGIKARITQKGGKGFHEENTAVVLVEPLLAGLGWDTTDVDSVDRQYRVFDGTRLDYALKFEGRPVLFLEVKALNHSLDDPKFISQTINYANNAGVLWCVLTNGVVYRLYKTNEPAVMDRKLMMEVDLRDSEDPASQAATIRNIALLSCESVRKGRLDEVAERVFVGGAVRRTLEQLLTSPTKEFVAAIHGLLGYEIEQSRLDRVLKSFTIVQQNASLAPQAPVISTQTESKSEERVAEKWGLHHHTSGKPGAILDIFEQLHERLLLLGDVRVIYSKVYINYSTPKQSFLTPLCQYRVRQNPRKNECTRRAGKDQTGDHRLNPITG